MSEEMVERRKKNVIAKEKQTNIDCFISMTSIPSTRLSEFTGI